MLPPCGQTQILNTSEQSDHVQKFKQIKKKKNWLNWSKKKKKKKPNKPEVAKSSKVRRVWWVLRCSEHVAHHKVEVAAELVEIHPRSSDHPNMSVRETSAQGEGDLLQTPGEPLGSLVLQSHLLLEVLHKQYTDNFHKYDIYPLSLCICLCLRITGTYIHNSYGLP